MPYVRSGHPPPVRGAQHPRHTSLPQYDKSEDEDSFAEPQHSRGLQALVCCSSTIDANSSTVIFVV